MMIYNSRPGNKNTVIMKNFQVTKLERNPSIRQLFPPKTSDDGINSQEAPETQLLQVQNRRCPIFVNAIDGNYNSQPILLPDVPPKNVAPIVSSPTLQQALSFRFCTDQPNSSDANHVDDQFADEGLPSPVTVSASFPTFRDKTPMNLNMYVPLYRAALKGDWEEAKGFLNMHPGAQRARITKGWETALHIAAGARHTKFVEELVKVMSAKDLAMQNKDDNTALCFAAASGITKIAEVMVKKNEDIAGIRGSLGVTPLYMAALLGHRDMVCYLYSVTDDENLTFEDCFGLLVAAITTDLFDFALHMLWHHPNLATHRSRNGETALHVLARKSSAFFSGSRLGIWERCIYPWIEVELCDKSTYRSSSSKFQAPMNTQDDFYLAGLLWHAIKLLVMHRQEKIFSLIYNIGAHKDLITSYKDDSNHNMLHLAGKLAPANLLNVVSGAALQMQRELLWFKEVEKIIQPLYKEMRDSKGRTPQMLFSEEHKGLVKEGEKWMKNTASSCMLVATLITTVMFAAIFTVPGGNNNDTGTPILLRATAFKVFSLSDAFALFSSVTSVLIFLSILTSRYAEEDFLKSLPKRLSIGMAALFLSIVTMLIAFSATFFLVVGHEWAWIVIPVALIACVPGTFFAFLQFPLLVDTIRSTYGTGIFSQRNKCMIY